MTTYLLKRTKKEFLLFDHQCHSNEFMLVTINDANHVNCTFIGKDGQVKSIFYSPQHFDNEIIWQILDTFNNENLSIAMQEIVDARLQY